VKASSVCVEEEIMELVGRQIGRYRIQQLLGTGGMGAVYLAEDPTTFRQVALKTILPHQDPIKAQRALRLFKREAKTIAKLNHPHILPLFDFGEESVDGMTLTYMVMPFYQDGSLKEWLRTSPPLSPQAVALLLRPIGEALQHAHDKRIIHRDIKPDNFLLRSRQEATVPDLLLADFGIAAMMDGTTSTGQPPGSPPYMAPEQWEGHPVPATDQYALAIMVYEMLTGLFPFQGDPVQVCYQHCNKKPQRPSTLNPGISQDIDAVILKALEKKPEDRYPSVLAFCKAFQDALHQDALPVANAANISTQGVQNESKVQAVSLASARIKDVLKPCIFITAALGIVLSIVGPFTTTAIVVYAGLVLVGLGWILGLAQSAWCERWYWFASILLLNPLATLAYGVFGPTSKPQEAQIIPFENLSKNKIVLWIIGILIVEIIVFSSYANYAISHTFYNTIAPGKQDAYIRLTSVNPTYYYPLINNNGDKKWEERKDCIFTDRAYHVNTSQQNFNPCILQGITFSNFVFQVQMTLITDGTGGFIFRNQGGLFYYFSIKNDGSYAMVFNTDRQGIDFHTLTSGTASSFQSDLGQVNTIAVVAEGNKFDLYVNQQYIDSVTDNSSGQGSIALVADTSSQSSTVEVAYSNAKIWLNSYSGNATFAPLFEKPCHVTAAEANRQSSSTSCSTGHSDVEQLASFDVKPYIVA
jgi:serine/threonine protein kinase